MDPGVAPWYAELASTDGLDVCKGDVLFVVLVVEDLVVLRNYVFFSTSFPVKLGENQISGIHGDFRRCVVKQQKSFPPVPLTTQIEYQ